MVDMYHVTIGMSSVTITLGRDMVDVDAEAEFSHDMLYDYFYTCGQIRDLFLDQFCTP